ncbi:MAG: TonB-dependent receptor [Gammaproteobacteria bacterium]
MRIAVVATAISLSVVGLSSAQEADAAIRKSIDIPAQHLGSALQSLAKARGIHVMFISEDVANFGTAGVSGNFTADEVLARLLSGTGLTFRYLDSKTVSILPVQSGEGPRRAPAAAPRASSSTDEPVPSTRSLWDRFRFAQATGNPFDVATADTQGRQPSQKKPVQIEEVVVTGSRLKRATEEGPIPVKVYTDKDIERSGQTNVADFLSTVAEVSTAHPENGNVYVGQTTVTLRGLPVGTTLVLLNGRRLGDGASTVAYGSYFDLNNIPAAVVERVEIVPEGSSAIYGSDALAGVVNIVLKKDFQGIHAGVQYGAASGLDEKSADLAWGKAGDRGSFSLIASYYNRSNLAAADRSIVSSTAYPGLQDFCNPGNVYAVSGTTLPGVGSASAAIRPGIVGSPSLSDFDGSRLNQCRYWYDADVIPAAERGTLFATGSYRIAADTEVFAEVIYTDQQQSMVNGHRTLPKTRVPASNAFNPFGTDVLVSYRFTSPETEQVSEHDTDFMRPLIGLRGKLAARWDWEVSAWTTRDQQTLSSNASKPDSARRTAALASSDPSLALNLFSSGAPASESLLASIYADNRVETLSRSRVASGFIRGDVFRLPAGPVNAVLGAEYARSESQWRSPFAASDPTANFSYERATTSAFSEVRIPLLAGPASRGRDTTLAMTAAVRYDHYDDFGASTTPQYALEWRPSKSLLVRGSYAESFKAPSMVYLNSPLYSTTSCCVTDPQRAGESTSFTYQSAGNPGLKPETGESHSLGLSWSPVSHQDLESSITWWAVDQNNRITSLAGQEIVNNENLFPGHVVRDPLTNAIRSVNVGYLNFGEMRVAGFDLSLSEKVHSRAGLFTVSASASEMYKYTAALIPGATPTDRLGKATLDAWGPRWKGNLGLSWARGAYSAFAGGRYVSRYTDYQDSGATTRQLGDFWLWDLSGRFDFGDFGEANNKLLRGLALQVGVVNVFDRRPQYSAFYYGYYGYDAAESDIRGRFVSVKVSTRF